MGRMLLCLLQALSLGDERNPRRPQCKKRYPVASTPHVVGVPQIRREAGHWAGTPNKISMLNKNK